MLGTGKGIYLKYTPRDPTKIMAIDDLFLVVHGNHKGQLGWSGSELQNVVGFWHRSSYQDSI
jgi:hypothetical protein